MVAYFYAELTEYTLLSRLGYVGPVLCVY